MNIQKIVQILLVSILLLVTSQGVIAGGGHHFAHYGHYWHHGHYGGHHGHGYGGALASGLIIGGLFGYLISEDQRSYRDSGYRDYRPEYYPRSTVIYERVERLPTVVTTTPRFESEFSGQGCRMTREYTTTIHIDGVDREAYGTRCLTADGSWILGRPKFIPKE